MQPAVGHMPPPYNYVCPLCRSPGHWSFHCPSRAPAAGGGPAGGVEGTNPLPPPQATWAPPAVCAPAAAFAGAEAPAPAPAPAAHQAAWRCGACDKDFSAQSAFDAHIKCHETCTFAGCGFEASPKVLAAHYESAHGRFSGQGYRTIDVEGQRFRVLVGTDPEEVRQWREERRKRFPKDKGKGLSALDAYGTSDEDSEDGEAGEEGAAAGRGGAAPAGEAPGTGAAAPGTSAPQRSCSFFFNRGRCKHGDACSFSHTTPPPICKHIKNRRRCPKGLRCNFWHRPPSPTDAPHNPQRAKPSHRDALLRMLLSRDMRREEMLILDCLRTIRDGGLLAPAGAQAADA